MVTIKDVNRLVVQAADHETHGPGEHAPGLMVVDEDVVISMEMISVLKAAKELK